MLVIREYTKYNKLYIICMLTIYRWLNVSVDTR